ncbi:PREDICTED: zinc finger HIT domain-containing protein 2 isoform X2 [Tarenaya hassleriana]|uniref:zinc finger HIT domain-containing protein 2 isoform X2 n=1 Tax=Tarenaya hassleriana TaxID=28532 RepID=UPI00053C2C09|nr:PREDICTED: zinc finger HIT domain-containing protein 2 isoform X2 [Tarenaya hassleriana]
MTDMILTSEKPSNPPPLDPPARVICHVCQKQFSQYTCPRCNSRYCSLSCYKSHSTRCTESFMRENVVDELRQVRSDDQSKQKMLEILRRFHAGEEEDEGIDIMDDSSLSEELIEKVLSGGEISLDDLTPEERKRFQRAVASGEVSKLIDPWGPWWLSPSARTISLSQEGTQLVQCITEENAEQESNTNRVEGEIPRGPDSPLPPLSKLSITRPSPHLPVHLVDIIYSSCFTLRIYNGDWQSDPLGSATTVLNISSVLSQSSQPETVKEVLSYCLEKTCSPSYKHMGGLKLGLNLVDDIVSLMSLGSAPLICLLSDLQRVIKAATREVRSSRSSRKSCLKMAERKVFFMMCWVKEQPPEVWSALANIVRTEKGILVEISESKGRYDVKKEVPIRNGGVSIEEVG